MSKTLEEAVAYAQGFHNFDGFGVITKALDRLEKLEEAIEAHQRDIPMECDAAKLDIKLWNALKEDL